MITKAHLRHQKEGHMIVVEILIHQGSNLVRVNPLADKLVNIWQANIVMNETNTTHHFHIVHQLK